MANIRIAVLAFSDLDVITDYIAADSVRYAQAFSNNFFERIKQLWNFPKSGRIVPEFGSKDLRELISGKYRIIYRIYDTIQW